MWRDKIAGVIKKIVTQLIMIPFVLQETSDEYPVLFQNSVTAAINYLRAPLSHVQPYW